MIVPNCIGLPLLLVLFIGGIVGLGWLVLQPLGKMKDRRVAVARFQLLDLFWLMILIQPPLAISAWYWRAIGGYAWLQMAILGSVWVAVAIAWATMTGALSQAGIVSPVKRAAGMLIILPMIGVVIPLAVGFNCVLLVTANDGFRGYSDLSTWVKLGHFAAELAFIAVMFGCRRLSRWIARGAIEGEPK